MAATPEIAVIVGDYSRRRYLGGALRSLADQTLARERFEIVVIKNYRDAELDRALAASGTTVLFDEEPRIGRWLRRAVNASRAPLVTFLDDDDEFEPGRLAHVVEVFGRYPDLGFYRNRVTVIDADGRPVPPDRWDPLTTDADLGTLGALHLAADDRHALFELTTQRTHASFNSSTMALRRELLAGELGEAFERTQLPDHFFLLAAVLANRALFLDDLRLTRYRLYPGNVSASVPWLRAAERSYRDMAELAARFRCPEFAHWLDDLSVHFGRMSLGSQLVLRVAMGADRREIGGKTLEYLRYLGGHPRERAWTLDTWAAGLYGAAYLGWPWLVCRFARTRLGARGILAG